MADDFHVNVDGEYSLIAAVIRRALADLRADGTDAATAEHFIRELTVDNAPSAVATRLREAAGSGHTRKELR